MSDLTTTRIADIRAGATDMSADALRGRIEDLAVRNREIHEHESVNLNPATNVMNPRAEAMLASGLGSRPSLGDPGDKYEMGLEAVEEIEVLTADAACRVFSARHAEVRVGSGALANLYTFMATCRPGDAIIVPPASIGGHVTHHEAGAAGLFGLRIHEAPVDAERHTIDIDGLASLAATVEPSLITIGTSLNLHPHPVAAIADIARSVDARVLFDAAHSCGLLAGGSWPNPLDQGADVVTMSTYKSLGGPAGGLLVTNDDALFERFRSIAYPGLTANFDAGKTAALGITLLDWEQYGADYATEMIDTAAALATALEDGGLPVHHAGGVATTTHQFALDADRWGDGHALATRLRRANILTCAIGLPSGSGLRLGTPEIVRFGMRASHMPDLAALIERAISGTPEDVAADVTAFRAPFSTVGFCS